MPRPTYLSKSRFKQALECPDKLQFTGKNKEYADTRNTNDFLRELAKGGIQVGELVKSYFPNGVEIATLDSTEAVKQTNEQLKKDQVTIFEAAIVFDNLLVRVDVLEKNGNQIRLYEAKSKSFWQEDEMFKKKGKGILANWKPYIYDIAFQTYVCRNAFANLTFTGSLFLIDKNKTCTVDGVFQKFLVRRVDEKYIIVTDKAIPVGEPILTRIDFTNAIDEILSGKEKLNDVELEFPKFVAALAEAYQKDETLNSPLSVKCKVCEYRATELDKQAGLKSGFEKCWSDKAKFMPTDFSRPLVFDIWNFPKAKKFIESKKYFIEDLTEFDFHIEETTSKRLLAPHQRQWLQAERVHNPALPSYFDKDGINTTLKKLRYPLHFIDFEATRNTIPYLKGLRPYAQLAFQFSHHILTDAGQLSHGQWIEAQQGWYPNFDFIRNLKSQLEKDSGDILIYSTYENTVLLDIYDALAGSNVADKKELMEFIREITWSANEQRGTWSGGRKMVDMKDWVMDYYFSPVTKGSNSIKMILPAIIQDSSFLRRKYPQWIKTTESGALVNPYSLLPPVFDAVERLEIEPLLEEDEIADGGAAMCAFNLMQFSSMSDAERSKIVASLLKYCELDTLAMVMIFEGFQNFGND